MSEEKMVEIQNLYVNFYTQSGVVKAIDGVNLTLYRGETSGWWGRLVVARASPPIAS